MINNIADEEREKRIMLIGNYAIKTGASTREIAEYFSSNYFNISNATVHDYLQRYKLKYHNKTSAIENVINNNTVKTVKDENISRRVLKVYELIKNGFLLEEIAKGLNESYWTIYRDIDRLKQIDEDKYNEIKIIFEERKENNIRRK